MTTKRWILAAAVLGSGIVFLDSTVVNVALPRIGRDLPRLFLGVLEGQSYVYNAYLLTLSALLILAGALTDYYGRKRMFIYGLVGFGLTSALCGLATNMEMLVLFRVLQGAAGAMLVPGSLALLTATFSGEEQGRAFGTWAGASGATTILGPVIGGLLVDTISWRAAFLINVPLVLLAGWATWKHVPESRDDEASPQFDWLGAAIVALAVGGLAFGAIYGQQREWKDPIGYVVLALGVLATAALPFWMRNARHPLIPLDLFRSRNFTVTNISTLVIYGSLYVVFYYLGLFQQGTLGYTAAAAVPAGIPGTLFLIFIFLTASFYSYLAPRLTGFDVYSATFRSNVSPLNTPADPHLIAVVREASTSSFHLAMLIGVVLLLAGAIVNAVGIRNAQAKKADVAVESGTAGEVAAARE